MSAATEPSPATLRRQVARAVRWNALVPLRIVAGSLASLALLNGLSKEDYGLVALVTAVAGLIGAWIDLGIERSLPKFYPEIERDAGRPGLIRFMREVVLFKIGLLALVIAAMLVAREPFFAFWASRTDNPALQVELAASRWWLFGGLVALLILGSVFDVLMQVLVAFFRMKAFNLIALVTSLLQPLLLIAAVTLLGLGVPGLSLALALVPAIAIGMAWGSSAGALRGVKPTAGSGVKPGFYGRLTRYSLTNYGQQLAGQVTSVSFGLIFLDVLVAAQFKAGFTFAGQVLQVLFAPLNGIQVPLFARLREERDHAGSQAAYSLISRFLLALFCPAAAGLIVLASNLIHILFRADYSDSAPVAIIMTVCLFGASLIAPARNVALVHERYRPILVSRIVGLIAIPLLFWLAPPYGAIGAALAIGGASLLAEVIAWVWAMRLLGLRYPWSFAARVLLACAVMVAIIWPLATMVLPVAPGLSVAERAGPALLGQLAIIAIGALVYALIFRLLGGLTPDDKAALASLRLPGSRYVLRLL